MSDGNCTGCSQSHKVIAKIRYRTSKNITTFRKESQRYRVSIRQLKLVLLARDNLTARIAARLIKYD